MIASLLRHVRRKLHHGILFNRPQTETRRARCLYEMENIIQAAELALPFPTKTLTPTTIYITPLLILSTAKMIFPTPSSCAFDVFAPRMMTSCRNVRRCPPFSKAMAIPWIYCRTRWKGCPPSPAKRHSRNMCVKTKEGFLWY